MKKIIFLNKKEGQTPLEALESFRKKNKAYKDLKMTYAGRLDPMASGLLVILAEEEIKNKEKYLSLEKEYEFEVLFGFKTDTYDILGKVIKKNSDCNSPKQFFGEREELEKKIKKHLKLFIGKSIQKYPMYSSKTVNGKPLFLYARQDLKVKVPEREVYIKKLELKNIRKISNKKLFKNIEKRIKKVRGDFRQKDILKIWKKNLKNEDDFFIVSFEAKVGSGVYVRNIANSLGEKVCIPALALSIKRTKIGKYML